MTQWVCQGVLGFPTPQTVSWLLLLFFLYEAIAFELNILYSDINLPNKK